MPEAAMSLPAMSENVLARVGATACHGVVEAVSGEEALGGSGGERAKVAVKPETVRIRILVVLS